MIAYIKETKNGDAVIVLNDDMKTQPSAKEESDFLKAFASAYLLHDAFTDPDSIITLKIER